MLEGKRPPGGRASWSTTATGYFIGGRGWPSCWRAEGHEVELVTGYETVAPFCAETLEDALLAPPPARAGRRHARRQTLARDRAGGVVACETELGETFELAADAVVLVTQRVSRDALYHELDGTPRAASTGSATASRRG